MSPDRRQDDVAESLSRLARAYARAIRQLEETLAVLCQEIDLAELVGGDFDAGAAAPVRPAGHDRPAVDRATFSVVWRGRACFLGNTLLLRFFDKLARRPGRYCSHAELLDEVWRGARSNESIRHAAKRLRDRLTAAGMGDLARAIDGRTPGHYALQLDRAG